MRLVSARRPNQVYHVTVMPCYDKKLEASRSDFYNELHATRDVDCVITTGELELLMREHGWDLSRPVPDEDAISPPCASAEEAEFPELLSHPGTSSGSYMHTLISALQANSDEQLDLATKSVRGADYEEYTLTARASGAVVFRGAKCYGFRNLQNIVRKVGRDAGVQTSRGAAGRMGGASGGARARVAARKANGANGANGTAQPERGYDYVEVMACPGGCINGGGQLRPPAPVAMRDSEGYARDWAAEGVAQPPAPITADIDDGGLKTQGYAGKWGDKEWTKQVEEAYWSGLPAISSPERLDTLHTRADQLAARVAGELCQPTDGELPMQWADALDEKAEETRRSLFRTNYRAVEGEVLGIAVKW